MDKKVGLIGGISSRELVLELKKTSKEVYMVGGRREEGGHDIADCFLHVDISEKELIANWFKENGVVNIVIGTGHRLAIDLAEYLEERGMITSINVKASKLTKNKTEFKKFLNERGYITPKYVEFNTSDIDIEIRIQTEIGVPCVLKSPTDVKSPQKTSTISELKEKLHQYIEGLDVVLVEEFVNGVDCTIPLIANYDNVKAILFSYYNKSKECSLEGFNSATDVRRVSSHMEKLVMSQSEQIVKDYCSSEEQ